MAKEICSNCFKSEGLILTSIKYGKSSNSICKNCGYKDSYELNKDSLLEIAHEYFVNGSFYNTEYGGSPLIKYNEHNETDVSFGKYLKDDIKIFEQNLGIGFFHYGPRLFMLGEVEPLELLQNDNEADTVLNEIVDKFPTIVLGKKDFFYRLRKNPTSPHIVTEYDSPPIEYQGDGRLDSKDISVLYGSENIEICFHECRVSLIDELYLAKMVPLKKLKILNLNAEIRENKTEFESLQLSIHFIFRAESHSYDICRKIAKYVFNLGFDGIIFPSYFSRVKNETIPNIALFGKPIKNNAVKVESIDRVIVNKVDYGFTFGPLLDEDDEEI